MQLLHVPEIFVLNFYKFLPYIKIYKKNSAEQFLIQHYFLKLINLMLAFSFYVSMFFYDEQALYVPNFYEPVFFRSFLLLVLF